MRDTSGLANYAKENRRSFSRKKPRLCVICGAKVRNMNPKTKTCSELCTEQLRTGKSLEQLTREASEIPKVTEPDTIASDVKAFRERNFYAC